MSGWAKGCVSKCVCERERECVCVWTKGCVREREIKRDREREEACVGANIDFFPKLVDNGFQTRQNRKKLETYFHRLMSLAAEKKSITNFHLHAKGAENSIITF